MIEQHRIENPIHNDVLSDVVDLRDAYDEQEVLSRIGRVIRGAHYEHDVSRPNMDMLQEMIEDWYAENWGKKRKIVLLGAKERLKDLTEVMLEVMLLLTRTEMWTVEAKIRSDVKADSITPYLGLRISIC